MAVELESHGLSDKTMVGYQDVVDAGCSVLLEERRTTELALGV
jgi:hypothetical protein